MKQFSDISQGRTVIPDREKTNKVSLTVVPSSLSGDLPACSTRRENPGRT